MSSEREVDLLIAGAGPAGMTAALVASLQGLKVLLCEKSGQAGGTGATSAGTLWIPGNHQSRKAGFDDSAEKAQDYLDALIGGPVNRDLRTAYLQTGPIAIDYLEDNSDVKFMPCGRHPDYRSNMKGAAVTGRAIAPQPFDGRLLGRDFARLRPPIREFMVFGGMMVGKADIAPLTGRFKSLRNFSHAAKLFPRYLADRTRYPRGTRLVMGNALVGRLFLSLKKRGVEILFDSPIADVVYENGRVLGAKVMIAGQETYVKTRKGVVFATGGYAHNKRFREAFMPRPVPVHSLSSEFNSGDGLTIGERLGARIAPEEHGQSGLWTPVSSHRARRRQQGPVSPSHARPRQAGRDRRQQDRTALRQRGGVVSRFRPRHVRGQCARAVHSLLPDLRRGVHRDIWSRHRLSRHARPLGPAQIGIPQARRDAGRARGADRRRCAGAARDGDAL